MQSLIAAMDPNPFNMANEAVASMTGTQKKGMFGTNPEVLKKFNKQLMTGAVVVIACLAAVEGWVDVYFAQYRKIQRGKALAGSDGSGIGNTRGLTEIEQKLKGLNGEFVLRHRDTFKEEELAKLGWNKEGAVLPMEYMIGFTDQIIPKDDFQRRSPRQTRNGNVMLTQEEFPIFRVTSLVNKSEWRNDHVLDYVISDLSIERYREEYGAPDAVNLEAEVSETVGAE